MRGQRHRNLLPSETTTSAVAKLGNGIADIPGTSSTLQASADSLYNSFNQTSIDFSNYNDKSVSTSSPSGGFQTSKNCQKEFENTDESKQQPPNKKHYDQQRYDSRLSGYGDLQANISELSRSQRSDNDTSNQSESGSWKIAQNKKWRPRVKKREVLEPRPICKNCSTEFVITESAKRWFSDRSLQILRRCEACRQGKKVLTPKKHPAPRLPFVPDLTPPVLRHSDTIRGRVPWFTHENFPTLQSHASHIGCKVPSNRGNTTLRVDSEVHEEESQSSDAATHLSVSNTHEDKPKGHHGKEKQKYEGSTSEELGKTSSSCTTPHDKPKGAFWDSTSVSSEDSAKELQDVNPRPYHDLNNKEDFNYDNLSEQETLWCMGTHNSNTSEGEMPDLESSSDSDGQTTKKAREPFIPDPAAFTFKDVSRRGTLTSTLKEAHQNHKAFQKACT